MLPVLEAVPNFSEGRDLRVIDRLAEAVTEAGADLLDRSADPDHNRAVLTFAGSPRIVEDASIAVARVAVEEIDLRSHRGAHPRVGALDVLPFVPLLGVSADVAVETARRVATRLADEVGVPSFLYGHASVPPGRSLAELRSGGFEALAHGFPAGRRPDRMPSAWVHPGAHPTAGVTCVGARPLLLAWNLEVAGVDRATLKRVAAEVREAGGGTPGLRALALWLPEQRILQLSMNLEDVRNQLPFKIFKDLEARIGELGGRVVGTEVIGLIPDELVTGAAADRLALLDPNPSRVLSSRLIAHVSGRADRASEALSALLREHGARLPEDAVRAIGDVIQDLAGTQPRE